MVRYRRNRDDDEGAVQLLRHPAMTGRPDLWWTERAVLARRALQKGNISVATTSPRITARPTVPVSPTPNG